VSFVKIGSGTITLYFESSTLLSAFLHRLKQNSTQKIAT